MHALWKPRKALSLMWSALVWGTLCLDGDIVIQGLSHSIAVEVSRSNPSKTMSNVAITKIEASMRPRQLEPPASVPTSSISV